MTLKELGWSQENIAYVIGCTRPALKRFYGDALGLTMEQEAKLKVLCDLQMTYKAFERQAIAQHAFDRVWKPAYLRLATPTNQPGEKNK